MDKINQFSSFKSGNNQKRMSNSPYDNLKRSYYDYIEQTNKSDFANSPRRYVVELTFVKNLIANIPEDKKDIETERWKKREQEIHEKLLEWGIKMD